MRHTVLAAALAVATLAPAAAQQPPGTGFSPGLGEFMSLQQMRHLKLWFAGEAKNWELAGYEADELMEGFEDIIKYFPRQDEVPIGQLVKDNALAPTEELKKAIEQKSSTKFTAAFDKLTAACNTCHQAANRAFIVIRRPASNPYSNQVFAPKGK